MLRNPPERLRSLHHIQEIRTALIETWCIYPHIDDAERAANELIQVYWRNAHKAPLGRNELFEILCAESGRSPFTLGHGKRIRTRELAK